MDEITYKKLPVSSCSSCTIYEMIQYRLWILVCFYRIVIENTAEVDSTEN